MIIIVNICQIKICILWPDNADIFYEKALSLHQYVETELNKKNLLRLSVFYGITFVNRCALHP